MELGTEIDPFDSYMGREINFTTNNIGVIGTLIRHDKKQKLLYFRPSVVPGPEGNLYIERDLPTVIGYQSHGEIGIRPLQTVHLEKMVEYLNKEKEKEKESRNEKD